MMQQIKLHIDLQHWLKFNLNCKYMFFVLEMAENSMILENHINFYKKAVCLP